MLIPAYRPQLIRGKPTVKEVDLACRKHGCITSLGHVQGRCNRQSAYKCGWVCQICICIHSEVHGRPYVPAWTCRWPKSATLKTPTGTFNASNMAEIRTAGANFNHAVRVTKHDQDETIQTFFHVPMNTRHCSRIYELIMDPDIKLPPPPCENNTTILNKPNKHLERFKALNKS